MEYLDIVSETGEPTGEQIERTIAHEKGLLHRTSHVWLFRKKNDEIQVLLQKRCKDKDSYPGCYDISSAGHIPAGIDFVPSAIRELKEELGIDVLPEELIFCGQRRFQFKEQFYGKLFFDNQVSNVYLLWKDMEAEDFQLQESEVEEVQWMNFEECMDKVEKNLIPHCIYLEELQLLKTKIAME